MLTTKSEAQTVPSTQWHYAPNANIVNGKYMPATAGFNLADVSGKDSLDSLPGSVKGLVWLGMCQGADSNFKSAVDAFAGDSKLWGFYLMDEPIPGACPASHLMAEADYIHEHLPGRWTFIVMENLGTPLSPNYMNTYNPANTHVDLFGLDPYPVRTEFPGGVDYNVIPAAVKAAERAGIALARIVPVYQSFGGVAGEDWVLPTAAQEDKILTTWGSVVPAPKFDYAYSWGVQSGDRALVQSATLQTVFKDHNTGE
jgi:hypothetical protein